MLTGAGDRRRAGKLDPADSGGEVASERMKPRAPRAGIPKKGDRLSKISRQTIALALSVLVGGLIASLFLISGRGVEREPVATASTPMATDQTDSLEEPALPDGSELEPGSRLERLTLGRGGNLASALDRLSVPGELRQDLLEAARAEIDPRRLSPRTGLAAVWDATGSLRSVSIRPETDWYVRLRVGRGADSDPVLTERVVLPLEVSERVEQGVVESCVAQALADTPHGTLLTAAFADVFQWDVDLLVEPRPGDRVKLVYEARRLGALPADLPAFGKQVEEAGQELAPGRILAASYSGQIAEATAFWVSDNDDAGNYYDAEGRPLKKTFLKSPLNYRRISSGFSNARRNPVTRKVVPHHGVDFAAAPGTPVVSTADGRVVSAGWDGALGRAVRIRHGSEYVTIYGHLQGFARGIRSGVQVRQNQVIGYVGSSGRATGPHLHYTMIHSRRAINPLRFENPPSEPLPPRLRPRLELARQRWASQLDVARGEIRIAGPTDDKQSGSGPGV